MKNSADQGGCYPQRPKAEVDNTLRDLQNSSYPTKVEFNNWFAIHSKYLLVFKGVSPFCSLFFRSIYYVTTRYPHLPCLQVGQKMDRFLPLEVCTIIPCERRYLTEQQIANMIRSTARPAPERQRHIEYWVGLLFFVLT